MSDFKWDSAALLPEVVDVDWPIKINDDGTIEKERVKHFELARTELIDFVAQVTDLKVTKDVEKDGTTTQEPLPFKEVAEQMGELIYDCLAKTTRGAKKSKWFKDLPLGANGMHGLIDLLFKLNHLEEVLTSRGNWMMLPSIRDMALAEADSVSPQQTSEA